MNKQALFLLISITVICACHKKDQHPVPGKSGDYQKAESFLYHQNDSAFYYFNKVAGGSKDSLEIARSYNNMAAIQSDAGDYFGAQESLSLSLKFLNEDNINDRKCLASDYNELGINSYNLKNYNASLTFYDQAIQFCDNAKFKAIILNNKANTYQRKHDYRAALKIYQEVIAQLKPDEKEYARILTNMVKTKWLQNPSYRAAPELLQALQLRIKSEDLYGQTASYTHLSDYYMHSHPDSALLYARKQYAVATLVKSPDDRLKALQKLVSLVPAEKIKQYFTQYQQLSDSIQTARNAAKNQFALIRYQAEKNKADNIKLQKDNAENRYRIIIQQILLAGVLLILILVVIWYNRRKKRLEMEALNKILDHELKVSKKVHDVLANGLYVIMNEIENQEELPKEALLDQIELLYERSRNISYEKPETANNDFAARISKLLTSFANTHIKVAIAGNNMTLWNNVSLPVRYELEHVLQELMVNMKKHSKANQTVIRFRQVGARIMIDYTDNGIGLPADVQYGNGLTNTGNRIQAIKGIITFDNKGKKGTMIQISFPAV